MIRHLHHSVDHSEIKTALGELGYEVRNVVNIRHWKTKDPLPLFFVDMEPNVNNKSIYEIESLLHTRIQVEAPRPRSDPIQCERCQRYGYTKAYCTLPFVCVKCGSNHDSRDYAKLKEVTPKCGNCSDDHTANYRGCSEYKTYAKNNPKVPKLRTTTYRSVDGAGNTEVKKYSRRNFRTYAESVANKNSKEVKVINASKE